MDENYSQYNQTYNEPTAHSEQQINVQSEPAPTTQPKIEEPRIITTPKSNTELDAELEQMLARQRARIKVIGTGGGGNNTINRITEVGVHGAETIAINTDAQDLLYTTADRKILIGREVTSGMGAGSNPRLGEEAAKDEHHVNMCYRHMLKGWLDHLKTGRTNMYIDYVQESIEELLKRITEYETKN